MLGVCSKCRKRYDVPAGDDPEKYACDCGGKLYAEDDPRLQTPQAAQTTAQTAPNVIACPDCGGTVSRRAPTCPHCGAPLKSAQTPPPQLLPVQPNGRIKVDTGENTLTRNRGCADLLIFIPAIIVIVAIVYILIKAKG